MLSSFRDQEMTGQIFCSGRFRIQVTHMKFFKLPLIASAIVLPLMLVVGIGGAVLVYGSDISSRKKSDRIAMMGSASATLGCVIIAPFWLIAAAKLGKERRSKMEKRRNR
jgi:uncharacterized membrane protein YjgN (DUF898 family)